MFKNNHLLRMFSMLALLACGSGEALIAEEPAPEKEKIHIVDLPADTEIKFWTKTSNKDGMKIVVLEHDRKDMPNTYLLALVRKDGTMAAVSRSLEPNSGIMSEIIWLNDESFLCYFTGRVRTFYHGYTIFNQTGDGYVFNTFCDGFLSVGYCTFVGKDGFLKIAKEEIPLLEITIPSPEKK